MVRYQRQDKRNSSWYQNRMCDQCGKNFKPTYAVAQYYCSNACKQKAYRERKKRKDAGK